MSTPQYRAKKAQQEKIAYNKMRHIVEFVPCIDPITGQLFGPAEQPHISVEENASFLKRTKPKPVLKPKPVIKVEEKIVEPVKTVPVVFVMPDIGDEDWS